MICAYSSSNKITELTELTNLAPGQLRKIHNSYQRLGKISAEALGCSILAVGLEGFTSGKLIRACVGSSLRIRGAPPSTSKWFEHLSATHRKFLQGHSQIVEMAPLSILWHERSFIPYQAQSLSPSPQSWVARNSYRIIPTRGR